MLPQHDLIKPAVPPCSIHLSRGAFGSVALTLHVRGGRHVATVSKSMSLQSSHSISSRALRSGKVRLVVHRIPEHESCVL
jgi:hypothetical protein